MHCILTSKWLNFVINNHMHCQNSIHMLLRKNIPECTSLPKNLFIPISAHVSLIAFLEPLFMSLNHMKSLL